MTLLMNEHIEVNLFDDIANMAEYLDQNLSEHIFPMSRYMFAIRDTFYGNIKYGVEKNKINTTELQNKINKEPKVEQILIYVYFAAYTKWIANKFNLKIPSWTNSKKAYQLKDYNMVFAFGPKTALNIYQKSLPEFKDHGILIDESNLEIV